MRTKRKENLMRTVIFTLVTVHGPATSDAPPPPRAAEVVERGATLPEDDAPPDDHGEECA